MILIGALMQVKMSTRGTFEIATAMIMPVVQATMAVYLLRAADSPHRMIEAAVGAGLMGVWSTVLFGSGGAIQRQRFMGTLEMLMLAPRNPAVTVLPITIATGLTGTYAMVAPIAAILPTTWGARAVHEAVSGGSVWPAIGWCLGISAICFLLGAVSMSFVERRARAAATLALS